MADRLSHASVPALPVLPAQLCLRPDSRLTPRLHPGDLDRNHAGLDSLRVSRFARQPRGSAELGYRVDKDRVRPGQLDSGVGFSHPNRPPCVGQTARPSRDRDLRRQSGNPDKTVGLACPHAAMRSATHARRGGDTAPYPMKKALFAGLITVVFAPAGVWLVCELVARAVALETTTHADGQTSAVEVAAWTN